MENKDRGIMWLFYLLIIVLLSNYWAWYMKQFHEFSSEGAGGASMLGVLLTFVGLFAVPTMIKNIFKKL